MSPIRSGFFSVLAIAGTLGVVQLASGHDLLGSRENIAGLGAATAVNRVGKADRLGEMKSPPTQTMTVALRLNDLVDTSVLIRLPKAEEARSIKQPAAAPLKQQQKSGKPTVACEPVVSVLTEVAKLLQPGRCIT